MEPYFSKNYTGGAFELFGTTHLLVLAIIVIVCLVIISLRHQFNPSARRYTRWGLLTIIYLSETSWHIWKLAIGEWTIQGMLPLWLCSLTVWSMPLLLVFRNRFYYEWVYFMGFPISVSLNFLPFTGPLSSRLFI